MQKEDLSSANSASSASAAKAAIAPRASRTASKSNSMSDVAGPIPGANVMILFLSVIYEFS